MMAANGHYPLDASRLIVTRSTKRVFSMYSVSQKNPP